MAQYDLLLIQNTHVSGTEFSEKKINLGTGGLLTQIADGTPTVLPAGTNGYMLVRDDTATTTGGLKWVVISAGHTQNTDTGTTSNTFEVSSDGTAGSMLLDGAQAGGDFETKIVNQTQAGNIIITLPATTSTLATTAQLHTQGTDVGTTSAIFEIDSDGFKIELTAESASILGVKVDGGATYADLKAKDLTLSGNLTVNGTTTTINSTTLQVDDKNIELGTVAVPDDTTADGGGITLKGTTDKTIIWDNANDNWTLNQNVNIPTSTVYKINNATVLSATQVLGVTLGTMAAETATNYVTKATYNVNTLLFATSDDTPAALLGTELFPKLWAAAPADKIGTGYSGTAIAGQMARDANWMYLCTTGGTATNQVWKRSPMATNWV